MRKQDLKQSPSSPAASPASPSPPPESGRALRMSATCGRRCAALLPSCGPVGCLGKMLLASSIWGSTKRFLTWQKRDTLFSHSYFRLAASAHGMSASELLSSRLMFPTPLASDKSTCRDAANLDVFLSDNGIFRKKNRDGTIWSLSLSAAVFYLTPAASETKVAKEKGYTNLVHFLDDGISGVTMGRPGFVEMIQQLEQGRAAAVFVKDLSRLGRNYIEVGRLTEEFFPEHDIRLVAVSDNIDTAEGENELAPIRNLFNEWYARDISKKRRISNKIKGNAGEPMGQPPYGYIKDPNNPKRWIVDDEAAQVVRRIYSMTLEGYGTEQIATQLEKDEILTPRAYWLKKGIKRPGKGKQQPATKWNSSTVTKILSLQEYCGDILNFKTYSKSYKNKKRLENDRENWVIFKDVHEPIIERSVFEQVQQKRGKIRKRRTNEGEHNMFSGLLVCADCGCNLHFHFNQGNPEIKYFNCSNYKGNRGSCTSTHYVRVDFLEQVVLGEIRRLTKFASLYEDEFLKAVIGHSQQAAETDRKLKEKELKVLLARDEELDGLFERIYEDNVSGKLSDDRFAKMSRRYEDEQKELAEKTKKLRSEIEKQSSQAMTTDMFISLVRKYTRARKLTPRMLNELVEKIEVYHAEKIDGVWEQRLRIHYNCVGEITIPKMLPLPIPDVTVNTRKGVFVNYTPAEIAG